MITIHVLTVRTYLQANSFEKFARDRYLPALRRGPTRSGQLRGARLLRGRPVETDDEQSNQQNSFLLIVDWDGIRIGLPAIDDPVVEGMFDSFQVEAQLVGRYDLLDEVGELVA